MRAQLFFVLAIAIHIMAMAVHTRAASPPPRVRPPAPSSLTCSSATASSLGTTLTNAINDALLPNATNTKENSSSNPYWSFTVPQYCWSDVIGLGQSGCLAGGTYDASTQKTTTVEGAFNLKVNISLAQTSCTTGQGAAGTWSMTATWPSITFESVMAVYPVTGGDIGIKIEMAVTNMVVTASGTYGYTVNSSTKQLCVTDLEATKSSITVADVTASAGLNGAPLTTLTNVSNKIESQITAKGATLTTTLNTSLESKVGKCKVVGTVSPPRPIAPPRSPRAVPPRG